MTFTALAPARLVDQAKAHLVVVPVDEVGGLIAAGAVRVAGRVGRIAERVQPGDVLAVDPDAIAASALHPEDVPITIAYEDEDVAICEKPAGVHVHPLGPHRTGTLLNALLWRCGARADMPWAPWRPRPLHRLDRAVGGLIAIAKTAGVHDALRRALAAHAIDRRYQAVVHGRVAADAGTIDAPLGRDPACDYRRAVVPIARGGQRAITHWTVIARAAERTVLALALETGRTHQLRAHLASIGHPIVGDALYATGARDVTAIALHAVALRLHHPRTGAAIACTSSPPADFGA